MSGPPRSRRVPRPPRPGSGPVRVVLDGDLPVRVDLGDGRIRRVAAVLDAWRVGNRWWRNEPPSTHLLVDLIMDAPEEPARTERSPAPPAVVTAELYEQAGVWRLERILD